MPKQTDIIYNTPPQPRQLRLDVTCECNARCLSCHRFLSKRHGEMTLGMVKDILDDIARWPEQLTEIVPTNYGEFFLVKQWPKVLDMIVNKLPKTQIVIPTNGSMLDEKAVKKLASFPTVRILNFSVNAYFEDTYEQFMGLPASNLLKIQNAIKLMYALRPDMFFSISQVFDPMYSSDLNRDLFVSYWNDFLTKIGAKHYVNIIPAASAGRGTKVKILRLCPCRSIFSDFVIGFDGKLGSCCFDAGLSLDLGNLFEYQGDVLKAWNNPKLANLRQLHNGHKRYEVPLCKSCTFE